MQDFLMVLALQQELTNGINCDGRCESAAWLCGLSEIYSCAQLTSSSAVSNRGAALRLILSQNISRPGTQLHQILTQQRALKVLKYTILHLYYRFLYADAENVCCM